MSLAQAWRRCRSEGLATRFAGAALAAAALLLATGPAAAHGAGPVAPADFWQHWPLDPYVLIPLALGHWLYGRGVFRLWRHAGRIARGLGWPQVAAFVLGEATLLIGLASPLEALSGTLLSAHMVQHVILIAVAPVLMVAGRPDLAMVWAVPAETRRNLARSPAFRRALARLSVLARPLPATLLHGLAMWVWHAPGVFDAALDRPWLHAVEHACFFVTALLFWFGIVRAARTRSGAAMGILAALITLVHSGFLGALLVLAPRPLYETYTHWAFLWGLTPLEDQQFAGAIMWVPMGALYLGAGIWLAARLLGEDPEPAGVPPRTALAAAAVPETAPPV